MKDVRDRVLKLQPFLLHPEQGCRQDLIERFLKEEKERQHWPQHGFNVFKRAAQGRITVDPEVILPGAGIQAAGWHVLDPKKPDGLNIETVKFADVALDKQVEAGELYVLERERDTTRLFFVWVPHQIMRSLESGQQATPLNFHLLFHPPAHHACYRNTHYWDGRCQNPRGEGGEDCESTELCKPLYAKLGMRYTFQYALAVAQHLIAVRSRKPNLVYVVPVADARNFGDLVQPAGMLKVLQEIIDFLVARGGRPGERKNRPGLGKIILSGYSRSGDRLEAVMSGLSRSPFFQEHLAQINAFDPNLHTDKATRLKRFVAFWNNLVRWKREVNGGARFFIYTAYPDHARHMLADTRVGFTARTEFSLERPAWRHEELRKEPGKHRGMGREAYDAQAHVGVVHLPVYFFKNWIDGFVNPRGFVHANTHGHGWFLRTMMSHALGHGDGQFFDGSR